MKRGVLWAGAAAAAVAVAVFISVGVWIVRDFGNEQGSEVVEGGATPVQVGQAWIERQVRVRVLQRMVEADGGRSVAENMVDDSSLPALVEFGVLRESGAGAYSVQTESAAWNVDFHDAADVNGVDQALSNAMKDNAVDWCGADPVPGPEFVSGYVDAHRDSFSSMEEYAESIDDYVDCGSGDLPG